MPKDKDKDKDKKDPWYEKLKKIQEDSGTDVKTAKAFSETEGKKKAEEEAKAAAGAGGTEGKASGPYTRPPGGDEKGPEIIAVPGVLSGVDLRSGKHTITQVAARTPEEEQRLDDGMKSMEAYQKGEEPPKPSEPSEAASAGQAF
jgi:hypothetical protein